MQKLVKLRKGEITVNSKPGEGSVFTFSMTLPTSGQCGHLNQLSLSMKRQPSDVDDDKLKGIRVLLVDSHPVRQVRDMKARYYMSESPIGNCCFGQDVMNKQHRTHSGILMYSSLVSLLLQSVR
jgi:hypothetical protein